nr:transposase family protein [Micromonospora tarapacensis]
MPCPTDVTDGDRRSLFVALASVDDPRDPRGRRYPLVSILAAAVCAVIAGACTFAAVCDWVHRRRRQGRPRCPARRRQAGPSAVGVRHQHRHRARPGPDRGEVE